MTNEQLHTYLRTLLGPQFNGAGGDLGAFAPELVLSIAIVLMLLWPLFISKKIHMSVVALIATIIALVSAYSQWEANAPSREIFQGMLVYDNFTIYLRLFLLVFTLLTIVLTILTRIPDTEDSGDFYTLLFGSVIGMSMMASANHLLIIFLAVEMASVPSYVMAGFLKGRRQSSEAALKYVVYGGAAAGVMLYGLTLLAGMFGTLHVPTLAREMLYRFSQSTALEFDLPLMLALMLVLVGIGFKLAAFPFHFWCPDVFEGAAAEVAAFLSVASKGAAIALLSRFVLALVGAYPSAPYFAEVWNPSIEMIGRHLGPTLAIMAAVTCTFGNLAAYGQTNLKRLLAYSTIAHAGYMMMALVPLSVAGARAALFYLIMYLFMNLGAFAVVAFVHKTGSEEISTYEGLIHRLPGLAVALTLFLISLIGLPPLGGFVAKVQIFYVLAKAQNTTSYVLLVIGAINSVISLVYYANVIRIMIIAGEPSRQPRPRFSSFAYSAYALALTVPLLYFGIFWQPPTNWSAKGTASLRHGSGAGDIAATPTTGLENQNVNRAAVTATGLAAQ